MVLCCPVCGLPLVRGDHALRCAAGHSFDVARQGYVNLLTVSQKHSKSPGDTREQVQARRAFLRWGAEKPSRAFCVLKERAGGRGSCLILRALRPPNRPGSRRPPAGRCR